MEQLPQRAGYRMGIAPMAQPITRLSRERLDGDALPFRRFAHLLMQISLQKVVRFLRLNFFQHERR